MKELTRQMVHLSGVLFVLLAQVLSSALSALVFFLIALTFLAYSFSLRRAARGLGFLDRQVVKVMERVERPGIPFRGAFWFYFSFGLTFLLFPLPIATAGCLILAISDSLSTLVGHYLGRRKILGPKTLEGTAAFFLSAAAISFFFFPGIFLAPALAATVGELLPEARPLRRLREKGLLDDNLTIPLLASLALFVFFL